MGLPRIFALLLVVALATSCGDSVTQHGDGDGPLAYGGAVLSMSIPVRDGVDTYTFGGIQLCVLDSEPVVLSGVAPNRTRGDVELAGALARAYEYDEANAIPVYKLPGWPPDLDGVVNADSLEPLEGFIVDVPCGPDGRPELGAPIVEILIGLRPLDRTDVVGWDGIDLSYTREGHPYVLEVNHAIFTCAEDFSNCQEIL